MATDIVQAKDFFGYCIQPDKTPSPIFEQLLLGIHGYIIKHVEPVEEQYLSPRKLSGFYTEVGGDFKRFLLESPPAGLSFVYSSLGCQHTLHQTQNLYETPTIPALTAKGFVRWQVIQVLLDPEEHVPYVQAAVKRFEILNTGPGGPFPKVLPAECLPRTADVELTKWHELVGQRLRDQCEPQARPMSNSEAGIPGIPFQQPGFQSASPRRRAQNSPKSPTSGRHSSTEARGEERYPNSPHPLRNAHRYERPAVESDSSLSSSSSTSPRRPVPRIRTPERSPRSYSAARHPYIMSPPVTGDPLGRRHSSHGLLDRRPIPSNKKNSLSPQFFAQGSQRPARPGNGPSPISMGPPAQQVPVPPLLQPQNPRKHRHTVSHDRKDETWRDKLSAYIGIGGDHGHKAGRRRGMSDPRDPDRDRHSVFDRERESRRMEGVRFAPGSPQDRRRASPALERPESDYGESRRSVRRSRRYSEDRSD